MILQELKITVEAEVIGATPKLTVTHRGIGHPVGGIALCNSGIGYFLQEIAKAEEAAVAQKMAAMKIVGPDGKVVTQQ